MLIIKKSFIPSFILSILLFFSSEIASAQSIHGALTVNGQSEMSFQLESESAASFFENFYDEYKFQLSFEESDLPKDSNEEIIFDLKVEVKKDGGAMYEAIDAAPFSVKPSQSRP